MKTYYFNSNGLRFDTKYLQTMKSKLSTLSVVDLAEFVDTVTYHLVHEKMTPLLKAKFHVPDNHDFDLPVGHFTLQNMNVTSWGNIAYVALYHKDSNARLKALTFLQNAGVK